MRMSSMGTDLAFSFVAPQAPVGQSSRQLSRADIHDHVRYIPDTSRLIVVSDKANKSLAADLILASLRSRGPYYRPPIRPKHTCELQPHRPDQPIGRAHQRPQHQGKLSV
jgi:hypothetical protein